MADIQSVTAEIRRGKKKRKKIEEETSGQKYNAASGMQGGHNQKCLAKWAR